MKKAVVIGSGFGGLAAAIRLQARGVDTTILEKRPQVGGRAYQFKEKGYTFDMGPSLITAPQIIDSVFQAAGRNLSDYLDLMPLDPYYRIYFHDGSYLDYSGDAEAMKRQMAHFNPQDAANYDRFMEACKPIYEAVITEGLGAKPFDTVKSMLEFVPRAMKLGAIWNVTTLVNRYFKDPRHRFAFSFHPLFIGGNPFRSPSIYLMIPYLEKVDGVFFTRGGMYSVVQAMEQLFLELGGKIYTNHEVARINVEEGRVTGVRSRGDTIRADIVISNADVATTYKKMIAPEHRRKWTDKRLEKIDYSMSCFLLYLGVKKQYPKLKHHTLILSERYKALIKDIFDNKILADDFSMYLHAPTRTDPSMAPEGSESLYVLIPVPNLKADIDWSVQARPFADKVLEFLEQWGMQGLRENLEVERIYTPVDFERDLGAYYGNAFAIEPKLTQTAYLRPHNASEDVKGLYFVGAGTHPGAGVPGVLLSAETTEKCIVRDHPELAASERRVAIEYQEAV